jgi:hypothetical protein
MRSFNENLEALPLPASEPSLARREVLSQMKGEEENLGEQHSLPSRIACVQLRADV